MARAGGECEQLDGDRGFCRSIGHYARNAAAQAKPARRVSTRLAHLLRKYGLTGADCDALYCYQHGRCAVCNALIDINAVRGWHIDHDHEHCEHCARPGFSCRDGVRGICCDHCNTNRPESVQLALSLALYLMDPPAQHALAGHRSLSIAL